MIVIKSLAYCHIVLVLDPGTISFSVYIWQAFLAKSHICKSEPHLVLEILEKFLIFYLLMLLMNKLDCWPICQLLVCNYFKTIIDDCDKVTSLLPHSFSIGPWNIKLQCLYLASFFSQVSSQYLTSF
jgi:hypothetical protein